MTQSTIDLGPMVAGNIMPGDKVHINGSLVLRLGIDMQKPFDAATEAAARKQLAVAWAKRGGSEHTEIITETDTSYSIDWVA